MTQDHRFMNPTRLRLISTAAVAVLLASPAAAQSAATAPDPRDLLDRLTRLEAANARLEAEISQLRGAQQAPAAIAATPAAAPATSAPALAETAADGAPRIAPQAVSDSIDARHNVVGIDSAYSHAVLEHTEGVNDRLLIQLRAREAGRLDDIVTLSGRVVVLADAHRSNRANKFGYLMRHPTGNNQRTKDTQEIAVSSAQLAFTISPHPDFTGYVEMLYDPEQSFGAGTLTALTRNQVQVRKAYVMWGNLAKRPVYAAAGKMDVPFGLEDSVNPFSNSTVWHAFAPLAYGGQLGYYDGSLSLRAMAIVGGAEFRAANTPVDGTAIPSKLNNFSVDGSYSYHFTPDTVLKAGASYIHGSDYCQDYPIQHFGACTHAVPAWSAYGRLDAGRLRLLGEFARTTRVWPGTHVPNLANPLSIYPASRVTSYTVGGRYHAPLTANGLKLSFEYSKFIAGPSGAPWNSQDQMVLGVANDISDRVSLFGEVVRIQGFAPLNFVSGGNFPDGSTWSDPTARSQVLVLGMKAGF